LKTLTHLDALVAVLQAFRAQVPVVENAGLLLVQTLKSGNRILTCGNGGSAADALHLAEELLGRYARNRRPLPGLCLSADPTTITCISNDFGYDEVFARQVEALGSHGDVLVVFSSSGNSTNIVKALTTARSKGLKTIALLGKDGGKARGLSDFEIIVPGGAAARAQEVHTFILHSWLEMIEEAFV
jgi:D-sedoheptulose 7-phosphate isomerase